MTDERHVHDDWDAEYGDSGPNRAWFEEYLGAVEDATDGNAELLLGPQAVAAMRKLNQDFLNAKPVEPRSHVIPGDEAFQRASDAAHRQILGSAGIPPADAHAPSLPSGESMWGRILDAYRLAESAQPRIEPIKLTQQQIDTIRAQQPERPAWESGVVADLFGVPIVKVDTVEESTPHLEAPKYAIGGLIRRSDLGPFLDEGGCSYVIPNRHDPNAEPAGILSFRRELTDEEFQRFERRWRWSVKEQGNALRILNPDGSNGRWLGRRPPWWKRAYFRVRRWLA